jgi:hypothetical protein
MTRETETMTPVLDDETLLAWTARRCLDFVREPQADELPDLQALAVMAEFVAPQLFSCWSEGPGALPMLIVGPMTEARAHLALNMLQAQPPCFVSLHNLADGRCLLVFSIDGDAEPIVEGARWRIRPTEPRQ